MRCEPTFARRSLLGTASKNLLPTLPMKSKITSSLVQVAVLTVGLFLAGCVSQHFETGTPLSSEKVVQIKKGVSTRADVEALFGPPSFVAMLPDGKRSLRYAYTSTKTDATPNAAAFIPFVGGLVGGANAQNQLRRQSLQVLLNAKGIVEDFEFSDSTNNTETVSSGPFGASNTKSTTTTNGESK